jgi:hypothetical protein
MALSDISFQFQNVDRRVKETFSLFNIFHEPDHPKSYSMHGWSRKHQEREECNTDLNVIITM